MVSYSCTRRLRVPKGGGRGQTTLNLIKKKNCLPTRLLPSFSGLLSYKTGVAEQRRQTGDAIIANGGLREYVQAVCFPCDRGSLVDGPGACGAGYREPEQPTDINGPCHAVRKNFYVARHDRCRCLSNGHFHPMALVTIQRIGSR